MENLVEVKKINLEICKAYINARSCEEKCICEYCFDFMHFLKEEKIKEISLQGLLKTLLNGSENWRDYSYSGNALIYDYQIAERFRLDPNKDEKWLDLQSYALQKAYDKVEAIAQLMIN